MSVLRGTSYGGSSHSSFAPSRPMIANYAALLGDEELRQLSCSDIFWDTVVSIEDAGTEEVFDLTVPGTASWLADGIVSHNSGAIEQDADLVMFIYRDEYYDPHSEKQGIAEIIIGKQRNGPVGSLELQFHNAHVRFNDLAKTGA
jgi:replicative DNA helicase